MWLGCLRSRVASRPAGMMASTSKVDDIRHQGHVNLEKIVPPYTYMRVCTQASPRWDHAHSALAPAPPPPRLPCSLLCAQLPSALCPHICSFHSGVVTSARCNDSWRRWPRSIEAHSPPLSAFSLRAQAPARGVSLYNAIVRRPPFGRHTPSVLPCFSAIRPCVSWQLSPSDLRRRQSSRRSSARSPSADVAAVGAVPVQTWRSEPSPGADVAGVSRSPGTGVTSSRATFGRSVRRAPTPPVPTSIDSCRRNRPSLPEPRLRPLPAAAPISHR